MDNLVWEGFDFKKWIASAESISTEVKSDYDDYRSYYENKQAPTTIPSDKTYVEENLITDMVNGMVGAIVGGNIQITYSGGDPRTKPLTELAMDMFDRSGFNKRREQWGNQLYVEGLAPLEFYYNPRKRSIYGVGIPEIHVPMWYELLLDPNSKGFMHEDDIFRILKTRVQKTEVERRWPLKKDEIYAAGNAQSNDETELFLDMYFIEFHRIELVKDEQSGVTLEQDVYYACKIVNATTVLEEPRKTGFSRFTLIPTIHTPRLVNSKMPNGAVAVIKQVQDMINQIGTIAYEMMKDDIKKSYYVTGVPDPDQQNEIRKNLLKSGGIAFGPQGSAIEILKGTGLSQSYIEIYQWKRKSFDEQSGRYAPERGASEQALSGVAISQLQVRGKVPELTKKIHMEEALGEVAALFLECAAKKMSQQQFSIQRKINGQKKTIYFNTPVDQVDDYEQDEYNVLQNGIINSLFDVDIDDIDVAVNITLNADEEKAYEAQKAMGLSNAGKLSTIDLLKKMYPDEYYELFQNLKSEQQAFQIVEMINQNPQAGPMIMQGIQAIMQTLQGGGQKQ